MKLEIKGRKKYREKGEDEKEKMEEKEANK
jgi:hypothetical protein